MKSSLGFLFNKFCSLTPLIIYFSSLFAMYIPDSLGIRLSLLCTWYLNGIMYLYLTPILYLHYLMVLITFDLFIDVPPHPPGSCWVLYCKSSSAILEVCISCTSFLVQVSCRDIENYFLMMLIKLLNLNQTSCQHPTTLLPNNPQLIGLSFLWLNGLIEIKYHLQKKRL